MRFPSKLDRQNALALATLPAYLASRPLLRKGGVLRAKADGPWVIGGHSGRVYEDNAAVLHARAHELGRQVRFVVAEERLGNELTARGYQVLLRNSVEARIAIENAEVLAFSHGPSDLDHALLQHVAPRGLRIHLFHTLTMFKAQRRSEPRLDAATYRAPFDYMLAVSPRERTNLLRRYPGCEAKVVLGGAAHLDAFMRQRDRPARRSILYFPTHRDTADGRARLAHVLDELMRAPRLHAFLAREDMTLEIAAHVNRAEDARAAPFSHPRVRLLGPDQLLDSVLHSAALISDYSGLLFDHLALGRPAVFFPFDLDDFVRERETFADYEELGWGPRADDLPALLALLESGRYRDMAPYAGQRRAWEQACFPRFTPDYADHTLQAIDGLLKRQREAVTPFRRSTQPEVPSVSASKRGAGTR